MDWKKERDFYLFTNYFLIKKKKGNDRKFAIHFYSISQTQKVGKHHIRPAKARIESSSSDSVTILLGNDDLIINTVAVTY